MFARNLLPVEFTDLTPRPLRLALELGGTPVGARVTLLSVLDDSFPNPDVLSRSGSLGRTTPAPARRGEVQDGKAQAEVGGGREIEVRVVRGHAVQTTVSFAETERCDLIVMATRGTRGFHHALLGSVTYKVIRQVRCPVLMVRLHLGSARRAARPPP